MAFLAMLMGLALAGSAPQEPETATQVEDVVVQGGRIDDQVRRFIDEVAAPPTGRGPARWRDRICVGVANIRGEEAQYVADRVSQAALGIGLNPGEPGCRPNILIIGASDGAAMARGLVEARRSVFLPGGSGMHRSRAALTAFQQGDRAVRWWHVSTPTDSDTGQRAARMPDERAPTMNSRIGASRLRTAIRNDLSWVIIILDLVHAEGLNFQQLADYAAMVALAQVDPDADVSGYDSVLGLFTDADVQGLTDWDKAYLKALYAAELNQSATSHQLGELRRLMARDRKQSEGLEVDEP